MNYETIAANEDILGSRQQSSIMRIHHNEPGVLKDINQVFFGSHVNIAAQYLQTDSSIGYVVMDVESDDLNALMKSLAKIPATIRTRILH